MVLPDGNIKVMDFGIARAKNSHLTQDNNVLGTAHYVSPEQTRGRTSAPPRISTRWVSSMYECATGVPALTATTPSRSHSSRSTSSPSRRARSISGVDADLGAHHPQVHGEDPANRFQTADELRQVLNSYLSGRAVNVSEPTRIIGAAGDLGATKTRELSDSTRAMVRPVSGVSGQNTARSAVSGSRAPTRSKSLSPTRTRSSPP